MNDLIFLHAKSRQDLERVYPVMNELRKDLTQEDFFNIYAKAHSTDNYEIVAIENHGKIVAVMGYRILGSSPVSVGA